MPSRRNPARLALAVLALAAAVALAWLWVDALAVQESAPLGAAPVRSAPDAAPLASQEAPPSEDAEPPATQLDAPPAAEPSEAQADQREEVAPPTPKPDALGKVSGWISPPPLTPGTFVLAARGGVLPLDCAATGWPLEPGDPAPEPVRRVGVRADGFFELGEWSPGPLRVLVLPSAGSGLARLERDDLWAVAGDTLLGPLALQKAARLQARFTDVDGTPIKDVRLYLAPQRLTGPVRALGWAACSPLIPRSETSELTEYELPAGRSTALALAPERVPTWIELELAADDNRLHAFELAAGESVRGELIDVDGLGLDGFRVGAIALRSPRLEPDEARAAGVPAEALLAYRSTLADESLRFSLGGLERGEALLLRALGDDRLDRTDAFAPEVVAFAGEEGLELERRKGAELAFELEHARTGERIAPFRAELRSAADEQGKLRLARRFTSGKVVWSDVRPPRRAANPLFADLPESEELALWIETDGFHGSTGLPFRLRTGERHELGLVQIAPRDAIHVRVIDAVTKRPIANARCELQPISAFGPEPAVVAESDREGRARLAPVLDLAHELYVRAPAHAPWRGRAIPISTGSDAPWTVELAPAGALRVRVLDAEQRPMLAEVLRRRYGAELGPHEFEEYERVLTDREGVAVFRGVDAGLTSVAARGLVRPDLDLPVVPGALTWFTAGVAAEGTSEIDILAAPALRLALELRSFDEPLAHALVRLAPDVDAFSEPHVDATWLAAWPTARADAEGRVGFEGLPARDYAVRVEHPDLAGFERAVVRLEPKSQVQTLSFPSSRVVGVVADADDEPVPEARVVAWALGPVWDEELEVEPRMTLEEIAPAPMILGEAEANDNGQFMLLGPHGVQAVLTAHARRSSLVGDYWLDVLPGSEQEEPILIATGRGTRLHVRLARRAGAQAPRFPGVVALCLDHPWGRGVVAQPLENDQLVLDDVPQGRWKLCAVELSHRSVILEVGPWGWVDELPQDEALLLPWKP
jgi:hypothetical protein